MLKQICFLWLTPLLKRCYTSDTDITIDDLPENPFPHIENHGSKSFEYETIDQNNNSKAKKKLFFVLLATVWIPYFATMSLELCALAVQFCQPYFLSKLIGFVSADDQCQWYGVYYAIAYCLSTQIKGLLRCNANHLSLLIEHRIKLTMTTVLYKKMLRLSPTSRKIYSTGDISNIISEDVYQMGSMLRDSYNFVTIPLTLSIGLYILWLHLGSASQTLIFVIMIVVPITFHIFKQLNKVEIKHMELKDKRLQQLCEVLNNIKLIKLLAWEMPFFDRIKRTRAEELDQQNRNNNYWSIIEMITMTVPMITAGISFLVFTYTSDQPLTAQTAFICLTVYNLLRMPLANLPRYITLLSCGIVSYDRILEFLSAEEHNTEYEENNNSVIELTDCSFHHDMNEKPVLKNINLNLEKGLLYMVVGRTGSGKSSFLSALMGDLHRSEGNQSQLTDSVAYVPQTAWIQNTSLRQNIVFVSEYDKRRFSEIIRACALESDLESLPASDLTPIGRRGVSLSGGQNHRVSLARAVYQEADVYLLDDPLSAVDAHVAQHLFHNVIGPKGLLATKTRVLVTHNLNFAKYADRIIVMDKGSIVECAGYNKMNNDALFSELVKKKIDQNSNSCIRNGKSRQSTISDTNRKSNEKPRKDFRTERLNSIQENQHYESIWWQVYHNYIFQCDKKFTILALIAILAFNGSEVIGNYFLNKFTSLVDNYHERTKMLLLYMLSIFLNALFCISAQLVFRKGAIRAATRMHDQMLISVLRAPMAFFGRTRMGRIIARFSRDINNMDDQIPSDLLEAVINMTWLAFVFLFIAINQPLLIITIAIVTLLFFILFKIHLRTSRQLHRLTAFTRPQLYSHLNESMFGVESVRAYKVEHIFVEKLQNLILTSIRVNRILNATVNWTNLWTAFIGSANTLSTALFVVFNREHMSPGLAAFILTYSIEVINGISMALRMAGQLDGQMVSLGRMTEYSRLESEGELELDCEGKPAPNWPSHGSIQFVGFTASYDSNYEPALKNINLIVKPGEKLGIVGRTGAGKSSLAMALMRIIEATSGQIFVDDVDISNIGLHDLRKNISIITQEPTLFAGTLRLNLDPFNEFTDRQLWSAIEWSHLKDFVSITSNGLLYEISENGSNLSGGQRQLVCLARALLRPTKILVLDEASAACDAVTDLLIRTTIKDKFIDCTVLTIAHRLDTILDYNSVVVLDNGSIVEYDSPKHLLDNCNSIFYGLAKEYGIV